MHSWHTLITLLKVPTPIRGFAAGPGYDFRRLCPKQGYIISHDSVLNRVQNFVQVCPKQCAWFVLVCSNYKQGVQITLCLYHRLSLLAYLVFLHYLCIKFPTATRHLYIWIVTTFRFFIKSPEERRLVRAKYRETSSRFSLCCFVIYVYVSCTVDFVLVQIFSMSSPWNTTTFLHRVCILGIFLS